MSFRNRPVLDRRHRPRWREERRTQQIVVAAFALAIAVVVGIFGAVAWSDYYHRHLRPVAVVAGRTFDVDALNIRTRVVQVELILLAEALQARSEPGDPALEQQLSAVQQELSNAGSVAAQSLVNGAVHRSLAPELAISVPEADVDAEIADRATFDEEARLSVIVLGALPPDAAPGTTASEEEFAAALGRARDVLSRLRAGASFEELVATESDDPSAPSGGSIGWIAPDDPRHAVLFAATRGLEEGSIAGPIRTASGYTVVRLDAYRAELRNEDHLDRFRQAGVGVADYRAYIADELLDDAFRAYFAEEVAVSPQEQRRAAQILIGEQEGDPVPERRVRHVLIQPLPGEQDQTAATEEQWQAALARAQEVRERLLAPDADWTAIAAAESADPGSAQQGGDLGWAPANGAGFVPEFASAMGTLAVGELSEPVRSQFGYHLIQVTDERESVAAYVDRVLAEIAEDPARFPEIARRASDDAETAADGGEIGWVARYELDGQREQAIFALTTPGEVSAPVVVTGTGTYIFQLLETAEQRDVEAERLERIRQEGYARWLDERRATLEVWIDPEFEPAPPVPQPGAPV